MVVDRLVEWFWVIGAGPWAGLTGIGTVINKLPDLSARYPSQPGVADVVLGVLLLRFWDDSAGWNFRGFCSSSYS
jgi:hypothetical protein